MPKDKAKAFTLTLKEREMLLELMKVLEWFEWATNQLQGDGLTISRVYPVTRKLLYNLDHETTPNPSKFTRIIRQNLRKSLLERFSAMREKDVCVVSTFLDPQFGIHAFEADKQAAVKSESNYIA